MKAKVDFIKLNYLIIFVYILAFILCLLLLRDNEITFEGLSNMIFLNNYELSEMGLILPVNLYFIFIFQLLSIFYLYNKDSLDSYNYLMFLRHRCQKDSVFIKIILIKKIKLLMTFITMEIFTYFILMIIFRVPLIEMTDILGVLQYLLVRQIKLYIISIPVYFSGLRNNSHSMFSIVFIIIVTVSGIDFINNTTFITLNTNFLNIDSVMFILISAICSYFLLKKFLDLNPRGV